MLYPKNGLRTFALYCLLAGVIGCHAEPRTTHNIRILGSDDFIRRPNSTRLIVFVHGFLGDAAGTWTHPRTGAYWPQLLLSDPAFNGADIFVYGYESRMLAQNLSIDELADNMRLRLQAAKATDQYKEVVFLAHSMGGVVTRAFLLKYRDFLNVPMVYFFATPTNGADLGNLVALAGNNPQAEGIRKLRDNLFLQSQVSSWLASPVARTVRSYCAYETRDTHGIRVVPRDSATSLCNERLDPIAEDHFRIVKPADESADSYIAFKVAYEEVFANQRLVPQIGDIEIGESSDIPWKDGTLITGNLVVRDRRVEVPTSGLIVANTIYLEGTARLEGPFFAVVAGSISGGRIVSSGPPGKPGGEVVVAVGRLIGTTIDARG